LRLLRTAQVRRLAANRGCPSVYQRLPSDEGPILPKRRRDSLDGVSAFAVAIVPESVAAMRGAQSST